MTPGPGAAKRTADEMSDSTVADEPGAKKGKGRKGKGKAGKKVGKKAVGGGGGGGAGPSTRSGVTSGPPKTVTIPTSNAFAALASPAPDLERSFAPETTTKSANPSVIEKEKENKTKKKDGSSSSDESSMSE